MPTGVQTLTHVSPEEVNEIAQDFESEGARVVARREPGGTWSVTGIFPARTEEELLEEEAEA